MCMNNVTWLQSAERSAETYDARSNRKTKKLNKDEAQKLRYSSGYIQFYG